MKDKKKWILVGIIILSIIGIFSGGEEDITANIVEEVKINEIQDILKEKTTFLVTKVVDGDTIDIETGERVRFVCIDTPERGDFYYKEAKDFLTNYILNKEVKLVKDITEKDRYGRILRYVYLEDEFVNGILVEKGYAKVYRYNPDVTLCDDLSVLERKAKNSKLGIWGEVVVEKEEVKVSTNSDYICSSNYYNCGDFSTHTKAQKVFELCGSDIHQLDRDEDGIACEWLS